MRIGLVFALAVLGGTASSEMQAQQARDASDSIAVHFEALAAIDATPTCMQWSDPTMNPRGRPVASGCIAESHDTLTYFYRTDSGELFAVVRTMRLNPDSAQTTSAHAESALMAMYGMPEACKDDHWHFIFDVAKILMWRRAGYTVGFETTEGGDASTADRDRQRKILVQIARGNRACTEMFDPPAFE